MQKKIEKCLKKAGFGERLSTLKKGVYTYIDKGFDDDGVMLSGGKGRKLP